MQYKVIESNSIDELQNKLNAAAKEQFEFVSTFAWDNNIAAILVKNGNKIPESGQMFPR